MTWIMRIAISAAALAGAALSAAAQSGPAPQPPPTDPRICAELLTKVDDSQLLTLEEIGLLSKCPSQMFSGRPYRGEPLADVHTDPQAFDLYPVKPGGPVVDMRIGNFDNGN